MATQREKFLYDEKGRKTAVVLPLRRYRKLLADLHDLALIAAARKEPGASLEEVERRLRDDGLLQS